MKSILFCDFDGTICHDRYWRSLPEEKYEKVQQLLFHTDTSVVKDWMRGKYIAEEVNHMVAQKIGVPYNELWRLFVHDCKTMCVPEEILEKLSALRDHFAVILMTVNMDSFSRFTVPALCLEKYFDHISNSYDEGKHKTDNQGEIFTEYVARWNTAIEDCIVIDDSLSVCKTFEKLGGTAYLVTPEKDVYDHVTFLEKKSVASRVVP